jgi:hypothetical protein
MEQGPWKQQESAMCTNGELPAAGWPQHEHLSAQLELDALRLLADAGTPELAKFAIDTVDQQQHDQLRAQFAHSLGFETYSDLLAASGGVATSDDKLWFVTALGDGSWIGWNYVDIRADVSYGSREAAIAHVERAASTSGKR